MTNNNALKSGGSLLERAAEIYDFGSGLRIAPAAVPPAPLAPASADEPAAGVTQPTMEKTSAAPASKPAATKRPAPGGRFGEVDREALGWAERRVGKESVSQFVSSGSPHM